MPPSLEVADIFQQYGDAYLRHYGDRTPLRHKRAMRAIRICRTAALGGHVDVCADCGTKRVAYNSCRNRHCPKCQFLKTERWIGARTEDLLPVPYYHVVFTLPEQLRPLALRNQKLLYTLLFRAASQSLLELAHESKHLGAEIGFTAVLHTWTQTLIDHPHLHCIVPGGGLSPDGRKWKPARKGFFLPVRPLSRLFRGKFLALLKAHHQEGVVAFPGATAAVEPAFQDLVDRLYSMEWTVYVKPTFANADRVVAYLGRYTHRIAISNYRLLSCEDEQVTFTYRDRQHGNRRKRMTVHVFEFIRRFLLHVLPDSFVKIRHYGLLSNRDRRRKLARCRQLLGIIIQQTTHETADWAQLLKQVTGLDINVCAVCGGTMRSVGVLTPSRASPGVRS